MPQLDQTELQRRALAHATNQGAVKLDPISLLILSAILSAVISHLVKKCLNHIDPSTVRNPGLYRRWQLRRLVRQGCGDPAVYEQAQAAGLDVGATDHAWGHMAYVALLKTGADLSESEAFALFQRR